METQTDHEYMVTVKAFGRLRAKRYQARSMGEAIRKGREDAGISVRASIIQRCGEEPLVHNEVEREEFPPEETLSVWFTPNAIREHFEGDDGAYAEWVASASDEQLAKIGEYCLDATPLWELFDELLVDGVEAAIERNDDP